MLPRVLEQIGLSDLQQLLTDQEQEGKFIEYKSTFYRLDAKEQGERTKQHEELLKDVSSFANTDGGDLLLGIKAKNGLPVEICGFETSDPDALKLRLAELVQRWLDPRISAAIHFINVAAGRYVFVIRVPKSLLTPHRVVYGNQQGQFWARNAAGAYMMDTTELRHAFTLSETIFDRIRAFKEDRVSKILSGQRPVQMVNGPKMILHLIPVESFAVRRSYLPATLQTFTNQLRPLAATHGCTPWNNLDGIVISDSADFRRQSLGYVQIFRNGIIEVVADDVTYKIQQGSDQLYWRTHYENYLLQKTPGYLQCLESLGISPPVWLFLTLTGFKGVGIHIQRDPFPKPNIDRDILNLPEAEITDLSGDCFQLLKPLFDMIWNAAGFESSRSFNTKNEWVPQ